MFNNILNEGHFTSLHILENGNRCRLYFETVTVFNISKIIWTHEDISSTLTSITPYQPDIQTHVSSPQWRSLKLKPKLTAIEKARGKTDYSIFHALPPQNHQINRII